MTTNDTPSSPTTPQTEASDPKAGRCAVATGSAVYLIAAERQRQISQEGWTPEHDDLHSTGELALAAACYALEPSCVVAADPILVRVGRGDIDGPDYYREPKIKAGQIRWPWDAFWYKRTPENRARELIKAGALIVAELERLQRAEALQNTAVSQPDTRPDQT